jgi:hypothetical protein
MDTTLIVSGEGAIIQCFACYPAPGVKKHEQNAITVSAKHRRKSFPVSMTPRVQAWALGGSVFPTKWLAACYTEMQV